VRKNRIAAIVALVFVVPVMGGTPALAASKAGEERVYQGVVSDVIDGDSIKVDLDDGPTREVRLIGVDSPEKKRCYHDKSKGFAVSRLTGKRVELRTDPRRDESDRNRLFAYVHLDAYMFNIESIRNGYARERAYGPKYELRSSFKAAQRQAKDEDLGLWDACS
jgi:micrococcal nuclease